MTDEPVQLRLVSPCIITEEWTGSIFAELEASFAQPSLRYHCVGLFTFSKDFLWEIIQLGQRCQVKGREAESGARPLLRIRTVRKMKVFDLMTGGAEGVQFVNQKSVWPGRERTGPDGAHQTDGVRKENLSRTKSVKEKIDRHNDNQLPYENIAMPEVLVDVYFDNREDVYIRTKMKLKRVMRYHHLTRDFVDEKDYPPTQEYFLYACQKVVITN